MNKAEYLARKSFLNNEIKSAKDELRKLEKSYISCLTPFTEDEKVKLILKNGTEQEAFISKISIDYIYEDRVNYEFKKVKKDGTKSHISFYKWDVEKILKLDEQTPESC